MGVKRAIGVGLCLCMVLGLTGCGEDKNWVFSIGDRKLNQKYVDTFGLIYAMEYHISDKINLDKEYEDEISYGDHYKEGLKTDIIDTVLIFNEAKQAGYTLSNEAAEAEKEDAARFRDYYGEDYLDGFDITMAEIDEVYNMKAVAEEYIENIYAGEKETGETGDEASKKRYIKVYQVTFSTVLLDENGMVKSGNDGEVLHISSSEMDERKILAEELSEKAKSGDDMEALIKDYNGKATGIEKYLQYDELKPEYKRAVDQLSEGRVSDVITSDYGYYVIRLLEKDASDYSESVSEYEKNQESSAVKKEFIQDLYDRYISGQNEYINREAWEEISFEKYVK